MMRFIGQVAGKPERRNGNWYFSIWNTQANSGINCISSTRFEVENRDVPFEIEPFDEIAVTGEVRMLGTCFFDAVSVLKRAKQEPASHP